MLHLHNNRQTRNDVSIPMNQTVPKKNNSPLCIPVLTQ